MTAAFLTIKVPLQGVRHEYEVTLEDTAEATADYLAVMDRLKSKARAQLLEHIEEQVRFDVSSEKGFKSIKAYLVLAPEHTDMDGMSLQVTNH